MKEFLFYICILFVCRSCFKGVWIAGWIGLGFDCTDRPGHLVHFLQWLGGSIDCDTGLEAVYTECPVPLWTHDVADECCEQFHQVADKLPGPGLPISIDPPCPRGILEGDNVLQGVQFG